jgi:hypothetical protein
MNADDPISSPTRLDSRRFCIKNAAGIAAAPGTAIQQGRHASRGGGRMKQSLLRLAARLACVALVVSIVFPLGRMVFPYMGAEFGVVQFAALEAVLSTTVGFGIYTAFFG